MATDTGVITTVIILTVVMEEGTGIAHQRVTGVTTYVGNGRKGIAVMGIDVHFDTMGRIISKLVLDPKRNNTRRPLQLLGSRYLPISPQ